jgi:iron complex outermembrane receptor protein
LAAFRNNYEDILTSVSTQVGPTQIVARSNGGSARATGAEAELSWRPDGGFELDASVAYLNAKFRKFLAFAPYPLATGYDIVTVGTTRLLDLSGYRIPNSPKFTFNVGGRYNIDLGSAGTITPEARFFWSDEYFVAESNYDGGIRGRPVGRMPSYTRTDLSLTWASADERYMVQAFVQNLEDEAVLNRAVIGGQGAIFQNFGAPRIFGVRAGFKM